MLGKTLGKTLGAAVGVLGMCGLANAQISLFFADLSGLNEVPPNGSEATGLLTGVYDAGANTFSFEWNIEGPLSGNPTVSHIHQAPAGVNGPVVFGFNDPGPTWPLSGSDVWSGLTAAQVDALFNEGLYANFHTTAFPGGELRGQILLVPGTGALGVFAVAGLVATRRRR